MSILIRRFPSSYVAVLVLLAPAATPAGAQTSEPSSIQALRLNEAVVIDGRLGEEAWGQAQHISNFTQREMDFGAPVSERTEVAVLFDAKALYIRDWDGVWEVETEVTAEGWFAEIRIPFSTLRFGPRPEEGWGINFERNIRRKREQVLWQGWSRDFNLEQLNRAGTLTGLGDLGSVRLVDVRPRAVGGVEWDEGEDRNSLGHLRKVEGE